MPIFIYCSSCFTSDKDLKAEKCHKCGYIFGRERKYRVVVNYRKRRITEVFPNLTIARNKAAEMLNNLIDGTYDSKRAPIQKKQIVFFNDLFERYLETARLTKKSWKADLSRYNTHIKSEIGNKPLEKITPSDIEQIKIKSIKSDLKPATQKQILVLIRMLFSLSERWELFEGRNPAKKVPLPKVDNKITEYLTHIQSEKLENVLINYPDKLASAFFLTAMFTGLRRSELFNLMWNDVDPKNNILKIRNPKGGITIDLRVSSRAISFIQSVPKLSSVFIFPGRSGGRRTTYRKAWEKIRKIAGLPDNFRFHGLRHNFGSQLASGGTPLPVIQELLTHKDAKTTQRYSHLLPDYVKEIAEHSSDIISKKKK
jgi:integrase